MLEHWQTHPVCVDSGDAALQMVATNRHGGEPFRLMLLDGNLPVMGGFELAERIRQEADNIDLAIIILATTGQRG
jgi:CheY-like chemotaxis protein